MAAKKKKIHKQTYRFEDHKWCIDNGWQVYPVIDKNKRYRIAIRRNGIYSEGKDYHVTDDGVVYQTKEVIGNEDFQTLNQLADHLPTVYKWIRERYE